MYILLSSHGLFGSWLQILQLSLTLFAQNTKLNEYGMSVSELNIHSWTLQILASDHIEWQGVTVCIDEVQI